MLKKNWHFNLPLFKMRCELLVKSGSCKQSLGQAILICHEAAFGQMLMVHEGKVTTVFHLGSFDHC